MKIVYGKPLTKIPLEDIEALLQESKPEVVYFETECVPQMGKLLTAPVFDDDFNSGFCVDVETSDGRKVLKDAGTVFLGGMTDFIEVWYNPEVERRAKAVMRAADELNKRKMAFEEFQKMGSNVVTLLNAEV
jgi:hypothetical protein